MRNYNQILPLSVEQFSENERRRRQEEECCNKIKLYICWTIVFCLFMYVIILIVALCIYFINDKSIHDKSIHDKSIHDNNDVDLVISSSSS